MKQEVADSENPVQGMPKPDESRVKIYLDETTGLHYIKGNRIVLFDNGVKVDREAFEARQASRAPLADLIRMAKADPENCGWDFARSCATTNLIKMKGVKKLMAQETIDGPAPTKMPLADALSADALPAERQELPRTAAPPQVPKPAAIAARVRDFFSAPYGDVIVITTVIGIACACMSMYHATVFLHTVNGKPLPVALITAFAMVLFAATAFTIARNLFGDRKIGFLTRALFSAVFVALGVAVISFLVFSTVTVNYEQFVARDAEKERSFVASSSAVSGANAELAAKETEIAGATSDVARLQKSSDDWYAQYSAPVPQEPPSENPVEQKRIDARRSAALSARNTALKNYQKASDGLAAAIAKRDKLLGERSAIVSKASGAEDSAKSSRETAYTVVAAKTGISEGTLKFLVYVIPPAFFDVVSPITLSVVLLLRERRRDKGKETESLGARLRRYIERLLDKKEGNRCQE